MQTLFLDIDQCSQLSGTTTQQQHSANEPTRDGSPACTCTTETCGCSTHPRGRDEWIASMQDSLARIFQSPVMAQALKESAAAYGGKLSEWQMQYDPKSSSWKTPQQSLLEDSIEFSETWPSWGMTRNGVCYPLRQLVPRTYALDGGALHGIPTPSAQEAGAIDPDNVAGELKPNSRVYSKKTGKHMQVTLNRYVGLFPTPTVCGNYNRKGVSKTSGDGLATHVAKWPTPTKRDYKSGKFSPEAKAKRDEHPRGKPLNEQVGGQLNPPWVEWLMGWPIGATALKHSVTDKYPSKPQQPMCYSVAV
jgi:hypothetical protein